MSFLKKKNPKLFLLTLISFFVLSCIEEVESIPSLNLTSKQDKIIIVEAIISDQLKRQEILLSSLSDLSTTENHPESKAEIIIKDELGNSIGFVESDPGTYVSTIEFSAQKDLPYRVSIVMSSGEIFESEWVVLNGDSNIQDLVSERTMSNNGIEGIGIFASSVNNTKENTFRYTYEETYKIIAPTWSPFEFVILNEMEFDIAVRQQEERTCFNTVTSNEIILADILESQENLEKQLVRFIGKNNFIISHRYSILVRQYVHSRRGYDFYRVLDSFSSNDNLFSSVQPGLIEGNISPINSDRKVIGLFDVVSVDEKRLFFDYEDFFANEPLPEYPVNCRIFSPSRTNQIFAGSVEYVGENDSPGEGELPILVTAKVCGDCTILGTNVIPDFWEE